MSEFITSSLNFFPTRCDCPTPEIERVEAIFKSNYCWRSRARSPRAAADAADEIVVPNSISALRRRKAGANRKTADTAKPKDLRRLMVGKIAHSPGEKRALNERNALLNGILS